MGRARTSRLTALCAALLAVALAVCAAPAAPTAAAQTITWSAPQAVDRAVPLSHPPQITGLACPSTRLCVGVEPAGIVTATAPAAGAAAWTATSVARSGRFARAALATVACSSIRLCVAADTAGDLFTSTAPAAGGAAWHELALGVALSSISCPTRRLCVGVAAGRIAWSQRPAGGRAAWHVAVAGQAPIGLSSIDCPSIHLCVAAGGNAAGRSEILTATRPAGGAAAWRQLYLRSAAHLAYSQVACPSVRLCVIADRSGEVLSSRRPAALKPGWRIARRTVAQGTLACPSVRLCVSAGPRRVAVSTNPAGGRRAWHGSALRTPLSGVVTLACPSTALCVAGDFADQVATSTRPGSGGRGWARRGLGQGYDALTAVACPDATLCMASDDAGRTVSSATAATGGPWTVTAVLGAGVTAAVGPLACPTEGFCAAASRGAVVASTAPTRAGPWAVAQLSQTSDVRSLSCPSPQLCVAGIADGRVAVSSSPAGGSAAWSAIRLGAAPVCGRYGCRDDPIAAVSCPSTDFCAATDGSSLWTTTAPGLNGPWQRSTLPVSGAVLDCPSAATCLLGAGATLAVTADAGDPAPQWTAQTLPAEQPVASPLGPAVPAAVPSVTGLACASGNLCVAVDGNGGYVFTGDPAAPAQPWSGQAVDPPALTAFPGPRSLTGVSCAPTVCVAVDGAGQAFAGTVGG